MAKFYLTLCNPMDCSTPSFPVLHSLLELAQTHVHWFGNAIQLSYPLSPPSPALNLSQHQGLFQWVTSLHQVESVGASASVPPVNIQGWFPLGVTGLISMLSKALSRVFSSTTVWNPSILCRSAFFMVQHTSVLTTGKTRYECVSHSVVSGYLWPCGL